MHKKLEYLIVKFINNDLNDEETTLLKELLNKDENKIYFKEYVELNYLINLKTDFNYEEGLYQFKSKIKKRINYKAVFKYAAIFLLFACVGTYFFIKTNINNVKTPVIVNNNIETGTYKASLTLEDGSVVALEKGKNFVAKNISSNGVDIIYLDEKASKPETIYNYLTVPRGGQYHIKLADGTDVWLNSESKLKYPISFVKGESREVVLVYGEAYFDVSPSTKHNGSKFKVSSAGQDISVLGTEFNIKAYKDEEHIYTTLVEGKIAIENTENNNIMEPNEQAITSLGTSDIEIRKVKDIFTITSWKKGVFSFKGKPLPYIMKVLSRWYDMDVVIKNKNLDEITFKGVVSKDQSIEEILDAIKNSSVINNYEINNKTVIIE
ncbi:DUF4974 domain-containing protein [Cellulophaga sp. 20_2_10]|uniref:FecR family protein n=1 Tax=Cellulophaga sp. 20_2_10 TaxID=2942476 RepID=UPI00201AEBB7|nr:FecR domain-containing protein [Cellulophaga sp. 20_2_10]MCL5247209.1 DUF4974 domain-containing protein [Cellulophaga sp. 20_2_10]